MDAGSDRHLIKMLRRRRVEMPQTQLRACISLSCKGKIKDAGRLSSRECSQLPQYSTWMTLAPVVVGSVESASTETC
jgi:hypothetical protein